MNQSSAQITSNPVAEMPSVITIAGNDGMESLIEKLCELFRREHPHVTFQLTMNGSSTAFPALASDACLIAPMARAPWAADRASFKSAKGYAASVVHIGYAGHGPRPDAKTPPSIYVHAGNPLNGLSMPDLARVFTSGSPAGDISFWHQLGLAGDWANRRIHLYGLRDDGKYASGFREAHLGGMAYAAHYEALPDRAAVVKAVADDPYGIGAIGWFNAAKFAGRVRVLPLSRETAGSFHTPCLEDVAAGRYPLSSYLGLYVDRAPDAPLSPLLKAYLRLALSEEGQALVAEFTDTREGYVRLSEPDLKVAFEQLEKL
jgi:phosphate transport system substrate-binding protein